MTARTTTTVRLSRGGPTKQFFAANEVVGEALILQTSTIAGTVEGDARRALSPTSKTPKPTTSRSRANQTRSDPALAEVVCHDEEDHAAGASISYAAISAGADRHQLASPFARALVKKADSRLHHIGVESCWPGQHLGNRRSRQLRHRPRQPDRPGSHPRIQRRPAVTHRHGPVGLGRVQENQGRSTTQREPVGRRHSRRTAMLLGLPVIVNRFVGAYTGVVLDRNAVVALSDPCRVATSEHQSSVPTLCASRHVVGRLEHRAPQLGRLLRHRRRLVNRLFSVGFYSLPTLNTPGRAGRVSGFAARPGRDQTNPRWDEDVQV